MPDPTDDRPRFTVRELAFHARCTTRTVRKWIKDHAVETERKGPRVYVVWPWDEPKP